MISFEGSIPTWSYNRLEDHTICNFRGLLKYGLKLTPPVRPPEHKANTAKQRGIDHHTAHERFVKGEISADDLPKDIIKQLPKLDWVAAQERYAQNPASFIIEEEWAWTRDWQPCDWFAKDVWGRAKIDRGEWLDPEQSAIEVTDVKTGKKFGNEVKHSLQMQLYAGICFMRFAQLQTCKVRLQYTDEGKETLRTYTREQAMLFVKLFSERAAKMTDMKVHKPDPSKRNCAYCDYGPNNGGTGACEYGVESK